MKWVGKWHRVEGRSWGFVVPWSVCAVEGFAAGTGWVVVSGMKPVFAS